MSTLRVSNIEAKSDVSDSAVDEKIKITNSNQDVLVFVDGKTTGITTVGINTTNETFKVQGDSNITITGIVTATSFVGDLSGDVTVGTSLTITTSGVNVPTGIVTVSSSYVGTAVTTDSQGIRAAGVITATSFEGSGAKLTGLPASSDERTQWLFG